MLVRSQCVRPATTPVMLLLLVLAWIAAAASCRAQVTPAVAAPAAVNSQTSYRSSLLGGYASDPSVMPPTVTQQVAPSEASTMFPAYATPQQFVVPAMGVRIDPAVTQPLLNFVNRQSDKERLLMAPEWCQSVTPALVLGAQFRGSAMAARTNTADRFSYLGRFPGDFVGSTVTDARMLQANQAAVVHLTPWAHGYVETLFSDVFTFPTFTQGSFQMRQAFVTFGNLAESPWYVFLGKKNVNFGDMGTLSPFSQSVVWHYFAPLGEGIGGGYSRDGLTASVTALNGSRGIRVMDSEEKGHLNNFAANIGLDVPLSEACVWNVGGGYLHGTIYDGSVAEHTNSQITGPRNGAWDANTTLTWGNWIAQGEIARTLKPWPVTGAHVTAWRAEAAYDLSSAGTPLRFSGSWSEGLQGPSGSEFEFNKQFVAGIRYTPDPHVTVTLEYVRSLGFAPLIDITTTSDRDVVQNSIVLGLVLAI